MRQLQPDRSVVWSCPKLRQEIERNRRRLLEIDHPETARVFQKLIRDAQDQLERIEGRLT
jgi:hypothetical protein